jgi:hypothetical protein
MLKNLIPFLQHFDKLILVRTCSQQVRQLPCFRASRPSSFTLALPRQTDEVTHMSAVRRSDLPAFVKALARAKAGPKARRGRAGRAHRQPIRWPAHSVEPRPQGPQH